MGGDHKCPLCSATFTRPQHVGRHLRAHTGDRPYECKQCPLKFARSDLLSRHVNKAHPKNPEELAHDEQAKASASASAAEKKASKSGTAAGKKKDSGASAAAAGPGPSSARSSVDLGNSLPYAYAPGPYASALSAPGPSHYSINGVQMQLSQSDSGLGVHPALVRPPTGNGNAALDYTHNHAMLAASQQQMPFKHEKARACDQCNHSKVKCDSGRPCAKCIHRSMACTYDKPAKHRGQPQSQPPASEQQQQLQPDRRRNSYAAPEQARVFHQQQLQQQQQQQQMGYYPSPPGMYQPSPPYVNYNPTFTPSPHAPTPSLTHGTSPAGSDELVDSQRSSVAPLPFVPTLGPSQEHMQWTQSPEYSHAPSPQFVQPQQYAPPGVGAGAGGYMVADPSGMYPWPQQQQVTFDPRFSAPAVFQSDDDDSSFAASASTNSSFIDLAEMQQQQALKPAERRLSTGVWHSAFDQMSLQDRAFAAAALPLSDQRQDYVGSHTRAVRPSFPTYTLPNGEVEQRVPSLSDTKDLWKMFMTDPALLEPQSQPQPQQTATPTGVAGPTQTPRPGMGKRTLSKSNSMPDLNSPLASTALFSSFLNGNTPRPGQLPPVAGQPSQSQQPAEEEGAADPATVRKWSLELQARQSNFKMQLESVGRKSSSPQNSNQSLSPGVGKETGPAMGQWHAMPPPPERPLASVRQGASLQQTLAPERVPSFNLTPQAWSDASTSASIGAFPQQPQTQSHQRTASGHTSTKMSFGASGVLPAFARPGNKRLPSQTLMPDTQKRASFLFGEEEDGSPAEMDYAQSALDKVARHQAVAPVGLNPHSHGMAPSMIQSPHSVSLNNNLLASSPTYSSPMSNYSPQTSNLPQPQMVVAAQTWATWPPLTAGQPQMAGLDDLRKGI